MLFFFHIVVYQKYTFKKKKKCVQVNFLLIFIDGCVSYSNGVMFYQERTGIL